MRVDPLEPQPPLQIAVIGAASADATLAATAEAVGRRLAERGAVVVSGKVASVYVGPMRE